MSGHRTPPGESNVQPLLPTWPRVRCDQCRHVYTIPETDGWVAGACPQCGTERYSTMMTMTSKGTV